MKRVLFLVVSAAVSCVPIPPLPLEESTVVVVAPKKEAIPETGMIVPKGSITPEPTPTPRPTPTALERCEEDVRLAHWEADLYREQRDDKTSNACDCSGFVDESSGGG